MDPEQRSRGDLRTGTRDGLQLGLRLLSGADGPVSAFTVEATIANVGSEPIALVGSLEPHVIERFPARVDAVRVAWEPGGARWPGADHYLGLDIAGPGWSDPDPRGSSFTDVLCEQMRQEILDRTESLIVDLPMRRIHLQPGASASRLFTWVPPDGWPGGSHDIVAAVLCSSRLDGTRLTYDRLVQRIPVEVSSTVDDAPGPAGALRALAANGDFQRAVATHGRLLALASTWTPTGWSFTVKYGDGADGRWEEAPTIPPP